MSSQLKQDLDKTYLTLELHGWCQQSGYGSKVCLEEAVALAVGRKAADWPDRSNTRQVAVLRALAIQMPPEFAAWAASLPDDRLMLWGWNDQPGRTVDEVKALIKAAWEVA